jgi:hypothetical protein
MNPLLAASLLLQDKSDEETFQRIEDAVEKARTVVTNFTLDGSNSWTGDCIDGRS